MAKIDVEVEIKRPVREVWDYYGDWEHWPEWSPSGKNVELVSGAPYVVGTKIRAHSLVMGRPQEWTLTVTEVDPYKLCVSVIAASMGTLEERDTFSSTENGTRFRCVIEVKAKGIYKVFAPFYVRSLRRHQTKDLARLRSILESKK